MMVVRLITIQKSISLIREQFSYTKSSTDEIDLQQSQHELFVQVGNNE